MLPETIAQIILESIKLARTVLEGIPVEERQKMWTAHETRMQFWQELFARLSAGVPPPGSST